MFALRPCQAADAEAIAALLVELWGHDLTMLPTYQLHQVWPPGTLIRQTLVATIHEQLVGAGTVFESTNHPLRLYVVINVARQWQRQGIGTALFAALRALGDGRAWQAKATRRDLASIHFLAKQRFYPIMHTLTGLLSPTDPRIQPWLHLLPTTIPGVTFISLAEPASGFTRQQFAEMLAAVYRRYHPWSPPAPFSAERAMTLFADDDLLADSAIGVFADGRLCGGAALYANDVAGTVDLANFGVVTKPDLPEYPITAALIRACVEWAARQGLGVRFEADVAYVPHRVIFESAPATEIDRDFLNLATL